MLAPHYSSFFTDRMLFLPPKQQRNSTEIEFGSKQRVKRTNMRHFHAGYSKIFWGRDPAPPLVLLLINLVRDCFYVTIQLDTLTQIFSNYFNVSKLCIKLGYLILMKIIKSVATRRQILRLKCTKFKFGWGSAPDSAGGAYSAPPGSLAGFEGAYF